MSLISNFTFLEEHDEQLSKLGLLAEKYFSEDPNTSLLKLRQLGELLAQLVAAQVGLLVPEETQFERLRRLQESGILPGEVARLFGEVRRSGNAASHDVTGDHRTALATLKFAWQISLWFHRTFKAPAYKSGPFVDRDALDDPNLIFRREGGGFTRLDRIFGGQLERVLDDFNETLWQQAA